MAKYFIQNTTLTNIADAIREKAGITSALFPENMPSYIRSIQTTSSNTYGIPDDIVEEAERVANGMISKMGTNSLTFIAMSDMHQRGDNDGTGVDLEQNRRANLNAGQAGKLISEKVPVDFFVNLGDLAWGASDVSMAEDVIESQLKARQYTWDIEKNHESFFTTGNHDTYSTDGYLTYGAVVAMTGHYRYVDFESKKVRVICLNTSDVTDATVDGTNSSAGRVSGEQLKWFAESLDLSSKSDASAWKIVILSHMPLDWSPYTRPLANCLNAYLNGSIYSITHDSVSVSYNFNGKNKAKIIAQFHGHTHCFKVDYINEFTTGSPVPTNVKRVAIPQCCFTRSNTYGTTPSWDVVFGEDISCKKFDDNTGRNTSFCLVSIDLDNEIIYADCFGSKGVTEPGINAGYDRIVGYAIEEAVVYNVKYSISGASASNTTGIITEGSSYITSIIVDDGYELNNIKVIMGTNDITSTAVNGTNITIENVTDDIFIEVTTTRIIPYAVSYDLANVTSSNTSAETASNVSYSTTLTADEGHSINFVRVLMNGEDVTSLVYNNGNIDIETVTGDIDIIAGYYTNLVPLSTTEYNGTEIYNGIGYQNGKYVSSGGNYGNDSNTVSTGYLKMNLGDVIYIKGAELANQGHVRLYTQTMSGASMHYCESPDVPNGQWATTTGVVCFNIEVLGDQYYKLTQTSNIAEDLYYRVSLYGTGEKLVITRNEPISDENYVEPEQRVYSIENHLTNVSSSNPSTSANEGSAYMATLTADDGYELESIIVTMGGSPVNVENGVIKITSITGNIVITAVATIIETEPSVSYTNLVPTSLDPSTGAVYNASDTPGYKNGKYASGANENADAACVLTGLITYDYEHGERRPIYIKGAAVDTSKSHCRIIGFKNGAMSTASFQSAQGSAINTYFNVETLGTNYYKVTPLNTINLDSYVGYLRFSLIGTGENLIITIDEPIE